MQTSRKAALAAGESQYATGMACKYGHVTTRNATTGGCHACLRARAQARYQADPATGLARTKRYQAANPEKVKETKRNVILNNEAHYQAKRKARKAANPERYRAELRDWKMKNPQKNRHYCSRRHARKLQRTPAWADLKAIQAFYDACPVGHHVDHILPLRGRAISGLHVLSNLQYLTIADNLVKKNRFTPYMVIHD